MSDQFEKDILSNINSFRKNPQSIQHQIEVLHRGIGRFKPNDPFLLEIEAFLKTITSIPKMQPVVMNKVLCDVALSEVKKYVKNEDTYNPYRIGKELEGIVPKEYMVQSPALIADNGADEADTIVPKLLLNRLDTDKKGRKIVCTQDFTQIGLARIRHEDENYYVIVFAKGMPKVEGDVTISVRQKDYVDNYLFDGIYTLIGEDGSVIKEDGLPYMQYVWGKIWVNNHAHILQGKNGFSTEMIYILLSLTNINHLVTGAVQAKLSQANMQKILVVIPPLNILCKYRDIIDPLFNTIRILFDESHRLSQLRDTLLPKLMSGEIKL